MNRVRFCQKGEREHGLLYISAIHGHFGIRDCYDEPASGNHFRLIFAQDKLTLWDVSQRYGIGHEDERGLVINISATPMAITSKPARSGNPIVNVEEIKIMKRGSSSSFIDLSGKVVSLADHDDYVLVRAGFETNEDYMEWQLSQ